jgi:hypothetical protein
MNDNDHFLSRILDKFFILIMPILGKICGMGVWQNVEQNVWLNVGEKCLVKCWGEMLVKCWGQMFG